MDKTWSSYKLFCILTYYFFKCIFLSKILLFYFKIKYVKNPYFFLQIFLFQGAQILEIYTLKSCTMMNCNFRTNSTLDQDVEEKQVFSSFLSKAYCYPVFKKITIIFQLFKKTHLWTVLKVARKVAAGYILRGQNIENIHMK